MNSTQRTTTIEIAEWSTTGAVDLSPEDTAMVRQKVNHPSERIRIEYQPDGNVRLHSTQHVGVVSLPSGTTLHIEPKAAVGNLLNLLRYANGVSPDTIPERSGLPQGRTFIDILGRLFVDELQQVVERGLTRSYERTQQHEQYLRGRLLVTEQVRRPGPAATTFACEYDEHTADTTLNQGVLAATTLLSELVGASKLVDELQAYRTLLRQHVTERVVAPTDLDQIHLTRLNDHYESILGLTRLILDGVFVEDLDLGTRESYAVLLDMNRVYEQVVERAFREVVDTRPDWTVQSQQSNRSLLQGEPPVELIPDIVLRDTGETQLVADAKWKTNQSNSDIYQIVSYELAEQAPGALIYPDQDGSLETRYDVQGTYRLELIEFDTNEYAVSFEEFQEIIRASARSVLVSLVDGFE